MIVFNQLKKPLKGRKRETDSERVGGGVMPAGTEPDNMGPRGPRRKATSSRGRNARVRSLTVLAVDEWVRQRCRVNAGWYRRIQDFVPAAVKLSGFLFPHGKRRAREPLPGIKHDACCNEGMTRRNTMRAPKGARGQKAFLTALPAEK